MEANQPTTGWQGVFMLAVFVGVVTGVLGYVIGYNTQSAFTKDDIDSFGMFKIGDHIYKAELVRAPYKPIDTFMGKTLEEIQDEKDPS